MSKKQVFSKKVGWVSTAKSDVAKPWSSQVTQDKRAPDVKPRPGRLPICPYGCGREGTLLEVIMTDDGRAIGIFNDHPCSCIFTADIEVGEPPTKKKYVIDADGDLQEVTNG